MPPQNSKHYQVPFGNDANFVNHPGAADIKIQPRSPKFLLDMRYFCNFSLVSLGIRPRSRRCAERTRQGEGRWSRPPKAALERSYSTENSCSANRILGPRKKKKLLTKSLEPKNTYIYVYVFVIPCIISCMPLCAPSFFPFVRRVSLVSFVVFSSVVRVVQPLARRILGFPHRQLPSPVRALDVLCSTSKSKILSVRGRTSITMLAVIVDEIPYSAGGIESITRYSAVMPVKSFDTDGNNWELNHFFCVLKGSRSFRIYRNFVTTRSYT